MSDEVLRRPHTVIVWQNGMVMVFDRDGEQIPELQGPESEAMRKLRAAGWDGDVLRRDWRLNRPAESVQ